MTAQFLVRERDYRGVGRAMYHKAAIMFGPWRTVGRFAKLEEAEAFARKRIVGIFQRCVFCRGKQITETDGRRIIERLPKCPSCGAKPPAFDPPYCAACPAAPGAGAEGTGGPARG